VQAVARRLNLNISPDPRPEQGSYYRSDHFSLARVGVPAFSVSLGRNFAGKPEGTGEAAFKEFNAKHYHQPSDEFREEWDFSGLEEIAKFGFILGTTAANLDKMPTWIKGDEFLAVREKSGVK
jgi:Zn-dependent M28 family amino/carboxypeptidase